MLQDPVRRRAFDRVTRRLGERLRELRVGRALSQEAAAELAGIHAKRLSEIESARGNVTLATLVGLSVAYGVPVSALFLEPTGIGPLRAPKRTGAKLASPTKIAEPTGTVGIALPVRRRWS